MSAQFIYYVYAYLRKDGTPYYIGKGKNGRAFKKSKGEIKLPKDYSRIIFLEKNLSEIGALALERRMIRWYGRKDLGTGILRNMTDGGDGSTNLSEESRRKMSDAKKGKPAHNKGKKGKPVSEETRKKLSAALKGKPSRSKGKPVSEETRKKLSEANRGKTPSEESIKKRADSLRGRSLSEEHRKKLSDAKKGKPAHNKGKPAHNKGMRWWNNGEYSMLSFDCPGEGWVLGKIKI